MLWLLLIVGVVITALAFPRVGKTLVRLFALLLALVILVPLALVVTFQRMRLKRRRRTAVRARAAAAAAESVEHGESPRLGPAIPSQ